MRITKKFTGTTSIGKRVFNPCAMNSQTEHKVTTDRMQLAGESYINISRLKTDSISYSSLCSSQCSR